MRGGAPAGARDLAQDERTKPGENRYSKADAKANSETLERAVMRSPDGVERFYARRGGASFTAEALGIACRYAGIETVRKLLEHGASFRQAENPTSASVPDVAYETMILPGAPNIASTMRNIEISPKERLEMMRLLIAHDAGDFSELLYQAVLLREFPIARLLIEAGTKLPKRRLKLINGTVGFKKPSEGVTESDRLEFRRALYEADDAQLMEMVSLLHKCDGVHQVAVFASDVSYDMYGSKAIQPRFQDGPILRFMLENTTMPKVVTRRMLVELVVENDDVETLHWMSQEPPLNR